MIDREAQLHVAKNRRDEAADSIRREAERLRVTLSDYATMDDTRCIAVFYPFDERQHNGVLRARPGVAIWDAQRSAVELANRCGQPVSFEHNGRTIMARPERAP